MNCNRESINQDKEGVKQLDKNLESIVNVQNIVI